MLADGQVAKTVELDEIFQALDPRTRAASASGSRTSSRAVAGRGHDLNDALGNLPAFADDANDLLTVLDGQSSRGPAPGARHRAGVRRAHPGRGPAAQPDRQRRRHLRRHRAPARGAGRDVPDLPDVPRRVKGSPSSAWRASPWTPTRWCRTYARPRTTSRRRCATCARLAPDLRRLFVTSTRSSPRRRTACRLCATSLTQAKPLLAQLQPFLEQLNPALQYLEYLQLDDQPTSSPTARPRWPPRPRRRPRAMGHYLRQFSPFGPETVGITRSAPRPRAATPTRDPTRSPASSATAT